MLYRQGVTAVTTAKGKKQQCIRGGKESRYCFVLHHNEEQQQEEEEEEEKEENDRTKTAKS
ncbi:hypothetical protein E2C01_073837 [Portunus trituberculatus]|uniref:Uncharacterized protein n=1 Tax=Portunus trituberculatus TaxID=210409 RepID=A0A5B7IAS1_PORTR|nr:hypothetical protein [Portunus trituberculatus]